MCRTYTSPLAKGRLDLPCPIKNSDASVITNQLQKRVQLQKQHNMLRDSPRSPVAFWDFMLFRATCSVSLFACHKPKRVAWSQAMAALQEKLSFNNVGKKAGGSC